MTESTVNQEIEKTEELTRVMHAALARLYPGAKVAAVIVWAVDSLCVEPGSITIGDIMISGSPGLAVPLLRLGYMKASTTPFDGTVDTRGN